MNRYQPIFTEEVLPGDTFRIMRKRYHVGKADKIIKSSEHRLAKIDLNKLSNWFDKVKINKDYALNLTDEEKIVPGIFVKDNGFNFLIDGWHRAYDLHSIGLETMSVYVIEDLKEVDEIRIK
jgi:hypothetical protein